jgi:hypothetical protein
VPGRATDPDKSGPAKQIAFFVGCSDVSHDEPLTLRTTVIAGIRYADDYAVVWRGLVDWPDHEGDRRRIR